MPKRENAPNFGYEINNNKLYKYNPCVGQQKYNSSQQKCVNYACEINTCTKCIFSTSICQTTNTTNNNFEEKNHGSNVT